MLPHEFWCQCTSITREWLDGAVSSSTESVLELTAPSTDLYFQTPIYILTLPYTQYLHYGENGSNGDSIAMFYHSYIVTYCGHHHELAIPTQTLRTTTRLVVTIRKIRNHHQQQLHYIHGRELHIPGNVST